MTTIFRRATPADVAAIAAFNQAMAQETENKALPSGTEADGGPVGCLGITFEWSDWRNGLFWWIQSVYIDPNYRRQGVFGGLYAHVTELAKNATDVCGIRLYVEHDNTNAQQTYLSLGMAETHYKLLEVEF